MLKIITKTKYTYNNNCVNQNINNKNISNMKSKNNINKLLILLTIVFGMGFNDGVVYGSSEASNIPMKSEEYLFNYVLKYDGFYEMPVDLFEIRRIYDSFCSMKIGALRHNLEIILFSLKKSEEEIKSNLDEFKKSLRDDDDVITKVTSFFTRMQDKNIEIPEKIVKNISMTKVKIQKSIIYYGIVNIILDKSLWLPEHRSYSYSVIRRINDLLLYDDGIITDLSKKALLDSLNKPLVASRRLLLSSIVDSDLVLNGSSLMEDISTKFSEEGYDSIIISRIDRKLDILPKSDGKQFGFKLIIEDKTTKDKSSFFVKSYMGYYGNAIKFSYGNETSSSPLMINSQESRSMSSTKVRSILNLKEPFMYSLLNKLNFAPEVHFIINPYITGGFFIATADLNNETKREKFFEIGHIAGKPKKTDIATGLEDESIGFIGLFNAELKKVFNEKNSNIFTELTKIDMLARIFRLEDFNTGNFGCVVKMDELEENKFTETCINNCEFKVIDFAPYVRDKNYTDDNINNNFLNGNTTISYSDESIMAKALKNRLVQEKFFFGFRALRQFQSRLGIARPIDNEEIGEDTDDFQLREILKQKSLEIRSLMLEQRGTDDKPQEVMLRHPIELESEEEYYNYFTDPESGRLLIHQEFLESNMNVLRLRRPRTNAELIGFKLGKKPEDYNPSEGQLDYIEDAFEDLDNYCEGIMNNYKTLKKFIIDGYNKYFDEQGNPKIQSVSEE